MALGEAVGRMTVRVCCDLGVDRDPLIVSYTRYADRDRHYTTTIRRTGVDLIEAWRVQGFTWCGKPRRDLFPINLLARLLGASSGNIVRSLDIAPDIYTS